MVFSVTNVYAENQQKGGVEFFLGKIVSSEDKYGEFIENKPEFSIFTPIFSTKHFRISSGISYLNKHTDIAGYEYNLTQLVVPVRVDCRVNMAKRVMVYAGAESGFGLLLETYDGTETFSGLASGVYAGASFELSKNYRLLAEYEKFNVSYDRLESLDSGLYIFRIGVGYLF